MALKCGNTGCRDYDKNGYGTHDCRHWIANLPHNCGFVEASVPLADHFRPRDEHENICERCVDYKTPIADAPCEKCIHYAQ